MTSYDFIDNIINESFNDHNVSKVNNINTNNDKESPNNDKEYELLIFTDGAHERVKKRSSFGIYLQCLNKQSNMMKYNKMKIIKKITKDILLYNIDTQKIIYHSIFKSESNHKCEFDDCKYFAIYNHINQSVGKLCKLHKIGDMKQIGHFEVFEPSNIRAEGYAILYALIILNMFHSSEDLDLSNITAISKNINNITLDHSLKFNECKYYNNKVNLDKLNNNYKKFLIITDSEFWINVITKWSNNWIKKKLVFEKKNIDLIYHINFYLNSLLDKNIIIDFKFVRGHSDKIKTNKLNIYQKGNVMADKLANIAKENANYDVKIALE